MRLHFTQHVIERMLKRCISEEMVLEALRYPDSTRKAEGKHLYLKQLDVGTIEVCCERTESNINILTVYWR